MIDQITVAAVQTYQVHRATDPYYTPTPGSVRASLSMPFGTPVIYEDLTSETGNPQVNHFYVVAGRKAAGQGTPSNRVGEFDFALVPGG